MNVVEFLSSLAKKDIRLWLDGENLRFSAPEGAFSAELRGEVVKRKPDIIAFLKQAQKLNDTPIDKADRTADLVLSFGQRRLWILAQLNPLDVTYNMASALALRGPIQVAMLEKTFATIVQRHEILRTRFVEKDGVTTQVVDDFKGWRLETDDLSNLPAEAQETTVQLALDKEVLTPYNLENGPLLRVRLIKKSVQDFVLIVGMHHVASDGWSMEVLVKELIALYISFASGQGNPLPDLAVQYADFAAWQHQWMASDGLKKQLDYWHSTLAGAPPVLALPTDRPRQMTPRNHGAMFQRDLPASLTAPINNFCQRHELTPFMLFLGAWQLLLGRYAHSEDVVVGSPIAGRSRPEFEELIGFFVNLLLMRADLSGNPTVADYFARVRKQALGAFSHQDVPIDYLLETLQVERQPGYPPVAQVAFQLINVSENDLALNGPISVDAIPMKHVAARMDMLLAVARHEERYSLSIEYNIDLFNASTVAVVAHQFEFLMSQLTVADNARLNTLALVSPATLHEHLALPVGEYTLLPLNGNQRSMLLDELAHAGTRQNAFGIYCEMPFELDVPRMRQAVQATVDQHAMLRAAVVLCTLPGADDAYLSIGKNVSVNLQVHDLSGTQENWQVVVERLMHSVHTVITDTMMHYHAVKTADAHWILVLGCHHIVLDGAATFLLMKNVLDHYAGKVPTQATDTHQAVLRYNDDDKLHCDTAEVLNFWKNTLHGVEPLDFSMPATVFKAQPVSSFNDRCLELHMQGEWLRDVRGWCKLKGISSALFFKAVYAVLLKQYCRTEEDFAFYEFQGNRSRELADAIGCFYQQSPVVLRKSAWASDAKIEECFRQLTQLRDAAKPFRRLSLVAQNELVPRARALFMFNYYNFMLEAQVDGVTLWPTISAPKVDKGVQFIVREQPDALTLELRYEVDVFDDLDFLPRFVSIVTQLVSGVDKVSALSFLLPDETHWLDQQNNSVDTLPDNVSIGYASIVEGFEQQVASTPERIAIIHGARQLTYAQLNRNANQIAHYLTVKNVGPQCRVALCLDRSIELVSAVWAVMKSGASYVPIDPAYPFDRIDHILKDCEATLVITSADIVERLPQSTCAVVVLDKLSFAALPETNLADKPQDEQEIYVIYTSGSTGLPKGAAVTHRGELNLQHWYLQSMQLTAQDRPVLISAVGFDLTQKNLFAPLLKGGAIILPEMDFYDDEAILTAVENHQATWINCAPSAFYPLVEADRSHHYSRLATLRFVVLGGEPIRLSALFDWLASPTCKARIMNSYGPTECTDVVAWHVLENVDQATTLIPIGKPVPNMHLHVVNDAMQRVPPGIVGEIVVTGIGVGLGYLHREELNASVFVANPFGGGRLYKTGDLGRYLPDGSLEYLGRKDFQIKLRGLRIELGEIEVALKALGPVSDSLVLVHNDQLVGYVLSDGGAMPDQWRDQLRARLPEYMVPATLVVLDSWPLTPNGKIDRKALPEPVDVSAGQGNKVAPRTPLEQEIAAVWAELLGKDNIGVLDNLFELGGNSITATRIASRLRKFYNAPLSVRDVFRASTIADLAVVVTRAQLTENIPPITAISRHEALLLSYAQQRLWMLDQFDPGLPAYNMPGAFRLLGELDLGAITRALQHIVNRHEILRSYLVVNDDIPVLAIIPEGQWAPEQLDLSTWSYDDRESEIERRVTNELSFRFNLYKGPLIRVGLMRCSAKEHVMITNMHHIVSDGWSNGIFIHELSQGYDAFRIGVTPALAPLTIQYADYAAWQRAWLDDKELDKQLAHWKTALAGVSPLRLPIDSPRKKTPNSRGASLAFAIPDREYRLLTKLCQQQGVTLYMALLAIYMVLLSRYANQRDISVGTPIANRNNEMVEGLIGFFVNTLVIRGKLLPGASFVDFLQHIRSQTLGAYAHQDVPFERLVDALVDQRDLYRSPLFQTMFALQNVPMEQNISLPDVKVEPMAVQSSQAKFELSMSMLEWQGELRGELEYRTDLFLPATAQQLVQDFCALVARLCAQPDISLHTLLSSASPSTGWAFQPEGIVWEQDAITELQEVALESANLLEIAIKDGHHLLLLAMDDAPAARHEVGEIYLPAENGYAFASMRTLSMFDREWVSTGLFGHCNANLQVILSCVALAASPVESESIEYCDDNAASTLEQTVIKVWRNVLGVSKISLSDDFFRLGGHSLLATRVISQLRKALGITIPIRTLFEHSRLHAFVAAVENLQGTLSDANIPPLVVIPREGKLPLSFTQQQLWLLDQLDPGNPAYNMPFALKIEGELDITAFNQAFTTIIERHEALRCNFQQESGIPFVTVQAPQPWKFHQVDLSRQSLVENGRLLPTLAREACEARFDISKDLLVRGQLIKLGRDDAGTEHFAILGAIHHMVSDGWSLNLITQEIATLYKAYREKSAALLAPLPVQYIDFAYWQRQWLQGEELDRQVAYWRSKLDNDYQVLDLPTDYPRPPVATSRGESFTVSLPVELKALIQQTASTHNATPFMVMLCSLYVALHRYSGQAGINIGTPIAGRNLTETEGLVGFFINTVIMSVELGDNPSLGMLLERVRTTALEAYAHQALPFEKIVEVLKPKRDPSRAPLFQVFFNLLNLPDPTEVSGIKVDNLAQDDNDGHAKYDINIYAKEFSERIDLMVVFNPDLYKRESVQSIVGAMVATLRAFEQEKSATVLTVPLLDVRGDWIDPTEVLPVNTCFNPVARVHEWAENLPHQLAIADSASQYTYQTLWWSVQGLAKRLVDSGVGEGSIVAIFAPRSAQLPLAILATLHVGACFTVLDPAYPTERLIKCCELSQPHAFLVADGLPVPETLSQRFSAASLGGVSIPVSPLSSAPVDLRMCAPFDPDRPAYIAFTSGTTGEPKGIVGTFNPVAHFVEWYAQHAGITLEDSVSMLSGLAHDPLLRDIFTPLFVGASLKIPAQLDLVDPTRLFGWLQEQNVSVTHLTPNLWQLLMQKPQEETLPALRVVAFGGDRLTTLVADNVRTLAPQSRIFNFYGATETPQAMGWVEVNTSATGGVSIPVGRGIDGVQLLVVNGAGQICHTGETGEIWIRTPYLTQGYLSAELDSRFETNPFTAIPTDRIYKTGDKGRYLADGNVEFLGRLDQQVKIRGYRVEPAEVQSRLLQHELISGAAVVAVSEDGENRLLAYVVPTSGHAAEGLDVTAIRQYLRRDLPEYMVPAAIIAIAQIPLTPNGKLNRAQLPDYHAALEGRELLAPRNDTEREILALWQQVLKMERISITDQFFDVGGHSLLATQVVARVKEKYAIDFSLKNIFEVSTIEGMARYVDTALWARQATSVTPTSDDALDDDMEEIEI